MFAEHKLSEYGFRRVRVSTGGGRDLTDFGNGWDDDVGARLLVAASRRGACVLARCQRNRLRCLCGRQEGGETRSEASVRGDTAFLGACGGLAGRAPRPTGVPS